MSRIIIGRYKSSINSIIGDCINAKVCLPCKECILQVFFSLFRNPHMEEADYIPYDLLDLEEYINPPDIYNFPPDILSYYLIDVSRLDLEKVLDPMAPIPSA